MEDTLGVNSTIMSYADLSLNPCFNGRYSRSSSPFIDGAEFVISLNPCFNGRYSRRV